MICSDVKINWRDFGRNELRNWHAAELLLMSAVLGAIVVITVMTGGDSVSGIVSAATGVMYTLLAGKGKSSCYLFGVVNSFLYGLISMQSRIYGDMLLNWGYYLPMQFVGIFFWLKNYDPEKGEVIKRFLSWRSRGVFLCCVLAAWCATAWGLEFFNARAPLLDSATTVLSIGAMILSVMRCFEQWICWTLVNSISIFMWSQIYRESGNSIAALLMWVIFFFCGLYFAFCWYKDAGDGK
ncbi:MAG: nicotinamide mononucleotide transporter [Lentisphaeria bacterium]|nr:nicotinamide mononucleotide transporter [Lentisphaeria bacterium]